MADTNTIQKKIPYGSNVLINCPNCGFKGEPKKHREGRTLTEVLLWILLLIPGAIYTAWRHINTVCICPKCGELYLEETDGDMNIVNSLIKIKRKQTIRFWIIVISFSILGIASFYYKPEVKIPNNKQNFGITNSINNLTDPVKYNQQINNAVSNTNTVTVEQPKVEEVIPEVKEEVPEVVKEEVKVEEPKDPNDEVREKMKGILAEIDNHYSNIDSYVGARCYGDCINGIIKIKFRENIGWYDFTVKAHSADWSNKIIREIPGVFEKIQIDFINGKQTICSCIFTEYQMNSMTPKGCTYYGYKE